MIQKTKVHFESGGANCVGYLYHPRGDNKKLACVIVGTGFGGTQDTPSIQAVARTFAEAGFAALTFDYRNFGESGGTPRQLIHIKEQLEDFHAAIRWARSQTQIDPGRIALWGTSLGGGHVIAVAADDSRIAAVIAQIPFNGFPKQVEGRSSAATLRLLAAMTFDALLHSRRRHDG
jgi:dienelactone hydrolase